VVNACGRIGREAQAAGLAPFFYESIEAGFIDRNFACVQSLDLGCVDVDAKHVIAALGKTSARDEAHVAGAKDSDPHCS
jgi:hypothetical protein